MSLFNKTEEWTFFKVHSSVRLKQQPNNHLKIISDKSNKNLYLIVYPG